MNCCLQFLLLNSLAGCFIFIILGIFVITDNPFLIIMNIKEKDGKREYGEKEKKSAYLQYFAAAGYSFFFAFIIWFLTSMKSLLNTGGRPIKAIKNEMQVINEIDKKINNTDDGGMNIIQGYNSNNNNEIITTNENEINAINTVSTGTNLNLGMTEKTEY